MNIKRKISAVLLAVSVVLGAGLVSAPAASAADYQWVYTDYCAKSWEYKPGYIQRTWYKRYWVWYPPFYQDRYDHYDYTNIRCYTQYSYA